jgi:hypothetical protein
METHRTLFSELKATEGGYGLKGARALLKANGIETAPAPGGSIYVGHVAFFVVGDQRTVERAENLLWP